MKTIITITLLAIALVGCTYRPLRGRWTGELTAASAYDRQGREYVVAAFKPTSGTPIPGKYSSAWFGPVVLVDKDDRAYPSTAFDMSESSATQLKGIMRLMEVWSFDGTEALGSKALIGRRENYAGGLVVIVKREDVSPLRGPR